jgi:uncharacterized protein YecE (DUF72 family)
LRQYQNMLKKLYIGTSTWSQKDWVGNFYPQTKPQDFLVEYAKRFPTVEIDSTFYAIPRKSVVESWYDKTPAEFIFSAKFPQSITHEKKLHNASEELKQFLDTMMRLKEKLGCLVLQFPPDYAAMPEHVETMERFLATLPTRSCRIALEVRHRSWLKDQFFALLHQHQIALVFTDQPAMRGVGVQTAPFIYIRWLGNRKLLSEPFTHLVFDKTADMTAWAKFIASLDFEVGFGYFNNHYAGHSPSSVEAFNRIYAEICMQKKSA